MVIAKRMPALIRSFRYQSFCLFMVTFMMAYAKHRPDLYIIAGLLFVLKVSLIPYLLYRIIRRIKANEDLGLFINPQLSLVWALAFTCLSWIFTRDFISPSKWNAGRYFGNSLFYSIDGHISDDIQDDRACPNHRAIGNGEWLIPACLNGFRRHAVFRGDRHIF